MNPITVLIVSASLLVYIAAGVLSVIKLYNACKEWDEDEELQDSIKEEQNDR